MSTHASQWVFGYGSLVWRPDFEHVERVQGFIEGFSRRFWQASTDHRGLPEAPGRVVTLVHDPAARCHGVAYCLPPTGAAAILAALDHREKNGYVRHRVRVHAETGRVIDDAVVYVATQGNPAYVGPSTLEDVAAIVRHAVGPSGTNREYVERLVAALRAMQAHDEHVFALAAELERPTPAPEDRSARGACTRPLARPSTRSG